MQPARSRPTSTAPASRSAPTARPAATSRFAPTRRRLLAMAAALGLSALAPSLSAAADAASAKPVEAAAPAAGKKVKVLYLTQSMGFRHQPVTRKTPDELASSEKAFIEYGKTSGLFDVEATQDAKVITPEKLSQIDVLAFYTTGALPISDENWKAVQDWLASGKGGFIGIHSATDTQWDYKGPGLTYTKFINGQFAGHPWGQGTAIKIATLDPQFPAVTPWAAAPDHKDEIYQYKNYDPKAVRVLQCIDFEGTALKKPYFVPITWVREVGKGRVFYTNLGHTPATWEDPRFRTTVVEAVKWVTHQTAGSAEPNPDVQALWTIHSFVAYGPDGKGQPEGGPKASAVVAKLGGADKAWLVETATKITDLRGTAPPDMKEPKAPNKNDEKKDPAKYAEALAKFEKDSASYKKDLPKNQEAAQKFEAARKSLLEDVMKKAGATTASAR
jgi:type 1 glutamine amidotransferase